MARRPASRGAQRGAALLVLMMVAVMAFAYVLTSRLNAASQFVSVDREANARALAQAKRALIGWMAANAAADGNPGRLPCPEAVNAIGTSSEGIAAPLVAPSTPSCATVGRLPWRTLGLPKLNDAASEPLWYVVSPGWSLQNSGTLLSINSDGRGNLVVDGQPAPNDVVALVIAPGPPMNVQAASGCTARVQARAVPSPAIDPADYIECFNAATPAFSTRGPATSFNDQAVRVTVGDLVPALEAAIQSRTQREIASVLSSVYLLDTSSPRRWVNAIANPPATPVPPLFPYAVAPFPNPGTSSYQGASGYYQGLLPVNAASSMVAYASTPGNASLTNGNGYIMSQTCSWETADVRVCEGQYHEDTIDPSLPMGISMTATFSNVAHGLRTVDSTRMQIYAREDGTLTWMSLPVSYTAEMNDGSVIGRPRGSVTIRFWADLPNIDVMGWFTYAEFRVRIERQVISDHPVLSAAGRRLPFEMGWVEVKSGQTVTGKDSMASGKVTVVKRSGDWSTGDAKGDFYLSSVAGTFISGEDLQVNSMTVATAASADSDLGWFVRNQWQRVFYYAAAQMNTADALPSLGCDSSNCLRFNDPATRNIRALLVLAGRSLSNPAGRPNGTLSDYVENQNGDLGTLYEQRPVRRAGIASNPNSPWNDRVVLVAWNSPLNAMQATSGNPLLLVKLP